MMGDHVQRLRALAEAATPGGPIGWGWDVWSDDKHVVTCDGWDLAHIVERPKEMGGSPKERQATMEFIAAANPETVLALCDIVEQAELVAKTIGWGRQLDTHDLRAALARLEET